MVYLGPSTGCMTCRQRKIKCDGNDPCVRCIRRNLKCIPSIQKKAGKPASRLASSKTVQSSRKVAPAIAYDARDYEVSSTNSANTSDDLVVAPKWYPRSHDSIHNDQSFAFNTTPLQSWKEISIAKYLSFVRSDPNESNPWTTMVNPTTFGNRDCSYFDDALAAVSLQRFSKEPQFRHLQWQAAALYSRATRLFRRALEDPVRASSDNSLISIRLLLIYGFKASGPPGLAPRSSGPPDSKMPPAGPLKDTGTDAPLTPPPEKNPGLPSKASHSVRPKDPGRAAVSPHFDGLLQMLLIRGADQTINYWSNQLYQSIRDRIIFNYSSRCKKLPVSREQPKYQWFFNSPTTNPAESLTNIAVDIPLIRFRMMTLRQQQDTLSRSRDASDLKSDAYDVIVRLRAWFSELPEDWQTPRVVLTDLALPEPGQYYKKESFGHAYPNPIVALTIGRYQGYQIMVSQTISACAEMEMGYVHSDSTTLPDRILAQESVNSEANQRGLVDDICSMLSVYTLRDDKVYELGREILPGGMQHGGHLIEPILAAQTVQTIGPQQRRYMGSKMMEFMGGG